MDGKIKEMLKESVERINEGHANMVMVLNWFTDEAKELLEVFNGNSTREYAECFENSFDEEGVGIYMEYLDTKYELGARLNTAQGSVDIYKMFLGGLKEFVEGFEGLAKITTMDKQLGEELINDETDEYEEFPFSNYFRKHGVANWMKHLKEWRKMMEKEIEGMLGKAAYQAIVSNL